MKQFQTASLDNEILVKFCVWGNKLNISCGSPSYPYDKKLWLDLIKRRLRRD